MKKLLGVVMMAVVLGLEVVSVADVFNTGGTRNPDGSWNGLASLETVHVGDPGNAGELSGSGAGGWGLSRVCGAVNYEYRIGKYEVTAGQYCEFLNAVAKTDTFGLYDTRMADPGNWLGCNIQRTGFSDDYSYSVPIDWASRPVNYVSWGDAARFANWLHNGQPTGPQGLSTTEDGAYDLTATQPYYGPNGETPEQYTPNWYALRDALQGVTRKGSWRWAIPTEDEWYKAAYYKGGGTNAGYFDYPTSSDTAPGQDMADGSAENANYCTAPNTFPIDNGKYTTVVGEFQSSDSPYGTFDQGGNVLEWNESVFHSWSRSLRGGSFYSYDSDLHAYSRPNSDSPTIEGSTIGFRVVQVPEPASMAVLALGSIGMFVRRRGLGR